MGRSEASIEKRRESNRLRNAATRAKMTPEERRAKRAENDRKYREQHREARIAADRERRARLKLDRESVPSDAEVGGEVPETVSPA